MEERIGLSSSFIHKLGNISAVLILIVVEERIGLLLKIYYILENLVLILIVMEERIGFSPVQNPCCQGPRVLILIVMEERIGFFQEESSQHRECQRLNPYCNGRKNRIYARLRGGKLKWES